MSGETELSGPDLAAGVALDQLPDGGRLARAQHGEAVLVVRRGEEIFAVGATCTHYGGPLAEGAVVGDTVRCPWHHACFSLRTGEAVRAPALNPVACYDGRARGGPDHGRREDRGARRPHEAGAVPIRSSSSAPARPATPRPRRSAARATGDDPADRRRGRAPLRPPQPVEGLPRRQAPPRSGSPSTPATSTRSTASSSLLGVQVTAIDPQAKTVTLADGRSLSYGALLLATGAEPIRLPIPGADRPHVHSCARWPTAGRSIAAAKQAKRAVVIGASFIGLEAAASLRAREIEVTVVAPRSCPLGARPRARARRLPPRPPRGARRHLPPRPQAGGDQRGRGDGSTTARRSPADLVVMGVGVRRGSTLAEEAGLEIDNGVVVERIPGDQRARDLRGGGHRPLARPLVGRAHPRRALGGGGAPGPDRGAEPARAAASPSTHAPFFWSQHYDVSISYVGHAAKWDSIEVSGSIPEKNAVVTYRQGGRIAAVATIFRDRESLEAEIAMEAGDRGQRWSGRWRSPRIDRHRPRSDAPGRLRPRLGAVRLGVRGVRPRPGAAGPGAWASGPPLRAVAPNTWAVAPRSWGGLPRAGRLAPAPRGSGPGLGPHRPDVGANGKCACGKGGRGRRYGGFLDRKHEGDRGSAARDGAPGGGVGSADEATVETPRGASPRRRYRLFSVRRPAGGLWWAKRPFRRGDAPRGVSTVGSTGSWRAGRWAYRLPRMRILVALGGNALLRRGEEMTAENQRRNVRVAAEALAPLAREHQLVITHGNGPQVGPAGAPERRRTRRPAPIPSTCWARRPRG